MKNRKHIIAIVALMMAILLVISSSNAKKRRLAREMASMSEMKEELEQKILTFDLVNYTEDGTKKWQLNGGSADILAKIVNLLDINMETYEDPKIHLTALKGSYDRSSKEISLYEDVEVETSDGAKLFTDYLKWHEKTDTITTDRPIRIVRSDMIADGVGAKAFPQMKKIILNEDVTVKLATNVMKGMDLDITANKEIKETPQDEPGNAIITCDGSLDIDYENNLAIFNENVLVKDQKGEIHSDKMEAFLDPVTKDIIKVVAEGEVKVVRGDDSTYSQKAIYTTADQKIVLMGRPRIYIHSTEDMDKIEKELEAF